jgi:hypothetical protein
MRVDREFFTITYDELYTKIFKKIKVKNIVGINRRLLDREDVYKFNIYFREENTNKIQELKFKTKTRTEANIWVERLRNYIKPDLFTFYKKNEKISKISDSEKSLLIKLDLQKIFYRLASLQLILDRKYKIRFMKSINETVLIKSRKVSNNQINDNPGSPLMRNHNEIYKESPSRLSISDEINEMELKTKNFKYSPGIDIQEEDETTK